MIYIIFILSKPFNAFRCGQVILKESIPIRAETFNQRIKAIRPNNFVLIYSVFFLKVDQTIPVKCHHNITETLQLACIVLLIYATCTRTLLKNMLKGDSSDHHISLPTADQRFLIFAPLYLKCTFVFVINCVLYSVQPDYSLSSSKLSATISNCIY